ncbi:hypothetical protein BSPLISOX_2490 [uncultured Gammaproteobacteria bacterium]|jgi:hypothetical protein|nr:hypothetical protein [uncultured Gammaproteobacteria bacterium]VVH66610.1 hypothetical protein BSPLISOX_2490 [uncultured Gammaproteobacteria bacterium]
MKNKSILAIMLATTMGFVNAGIFDDIEYSVVRAAEGTAHELKVLGKEAVDGTKSAGKTIYYGTKSAGKAIYHGASDVYNDDIVITLKERK